MPCQTAHPTLAAPLGEPHKPQPYTQHNASAILHIGTACHVCVSTQRLQRSTRSVRQATSGLSRPAKLRRCRYSRGGVAEEIFPIELQHNYVAVGRNWEEKGSNQPVLRY